MYLEIKDGILSGSELQIYGDFVVPDGIKEIAPHAFFYNRGITSVVFPATVGRIGKRAFEDCHNILKAVIPENAKIGVNAFRNCYSCITNLSIRQWKEKYGISKLNYALNYIYNYQSGDPFFDSVKEENNIYIKNNLICLIDMVSGDDIYFVNYVTREIPLDIDRVEALLDKFSGNVETAAVLLDYKNKNFSEEYLEKRAAEQTEKELGLRPRTVADWKKIFTLSDDGQGGIVIKKYKGKDTDVIIPDTIGRRRVTEIGLGAFRPSDDILNIRSVYIPESVKIIGDSAFRGCSEIEEIEIPDSVIFINNGAFSDCKKLKKLRLPGGLTSIPDGLVFSCSSLPEIEIPSSVTRIGSFAFSNCESLASVTIPDSVTHVGQCAFSFCRGLTEITLPGFLTIMEGYLFKGCENLTKAVIAKGVTAIPEEMFSQCRKLAEVQLPDGIVSIGHYAFHDCGALRQIILPTTVRNISDAFNECWGLEELVIPEGVTEISVGAFFKAIRLRKIMLPDSITEIGEAAFEQSGISSIKIPSGVTAIRENTFWCCDYLNEVEIPASVTEIDPNAFYLSSKNMVISAPRGSYAIEYAREQGIKFKELPI